MKCKQCGYEAEQDFTYCPSCGAQSQPAGNAVAKILPALKDPLFLVLCILMSISCLFGMLMNNFDVIDILITVFLWLTYFSARKDENPAKHLRCVSGSVFALYVINYVLAGLFLLIGVTLALAFDAIMADPAFMEALSGFIAESGDLEMLIEALGAVSGGTVLVIFAFIGIVFAVINIFSVRYFHGFAQSVYKSLESGKLELKFVNATYTWLIVLAILIGFSVLGALLGNTADATLGLNSADLSVFVICILLINKYLKTEN